MLATIAIMEIPFCSFRLILDNRRDTNAGNRPPHRMNELGVPTPEASRMQVDIDVCLSSSFDFN